MSQSYNPPARECALYRAHGYIDSSHGIADPPESPHLHSAYEAGRALRLAGKPLDWAATHAYRDSCPPIAA